MAEIFTNNDEDTLGLKLKPTFALCENYNYKNTHHFRVISIADDFELAKSRAKLYLFSNDITEDTDKYEINYDVVEGEFYKASCLLKDDRNQYIEIVVQKTTYMERE